MPVEDLSVIEGPLDGLSEKIFKDNVLEKAHNWLLGVGVTPSWVVIGAVGGALLRTPEQAQVFKSAIVGSLLGATASWLVNRSKKKEALSQNYCPVCL